MAKKIGDNSGSQDALLRSVKSDKGKIKLESGLKSNEEKLALSILNTVFEKSNSDNEYLLNLTSKNTDAILGRITTLLEQNQKDYTATELENIKDAIVTAIESKIDAVNNSTLDIILLLNKLKELLSTTLQEITDNVTNTLQLFFDKQSTESTSTVENIDEDALKQCTELITANIDFHCNKLNDTIMKLAECIDTNFTNIIDQVTKVQDKILNAIEGLQPTSKDKKQKKDELKKSKGLFDSIKSITNAVEKIVLFVGNFLKFMVSNFKKFLDSVFKPLCAFFIKLFATIVVPIALLLAIVLPIIAEPLMKILQPILDAIMPAVTLIAQAIVGVVSLATKIWNWASEELWPLVRDELWPLIREALNWILEKIKWLWEKLVEPLVNGFSGKAEEIGKGLGDFVANCVDTLSNFMKGLASKAEDIGKGLGDFVTVVLKVLTDLIKGFGLHAFDIGKAIGVVVLEVTKFVAKLAHFINIVADIIIDLIEPLKPSARKIGEAINNVLCIVLDVTNAVLNGIRSTWNWITDKLAAVSILGAHPFGFLKGSGTSEKEKLEIEETKADISWKMKLSEFLDSLANGKFFTDVAVKTLAAFKLGIDFLFNHPFVKHMSQVLELTGQFVLANLKDFVDKTYEIVDNIISGQFFKNLFDALFNNIAVKSFMDTIKDFIKELIDPLEDIGDEIEDAIERISKAIAASIEDISEAIVGILEEVKKFIEDIKQPIIDAINGISTSIKEVIEKIGKLVEDIKQPIIDAINGIAASIKEVIEKIGQLVNDIKQPIIDVINSIKESVHSISDKLGNFIDNIGNEIVTTVRDIKTELVNGIRKLVDGILQLPDKAVGLIVKAIKGILNVGKAIGNAVSGAFSKVKGLFSKDNKEEVKLSPAEQALKDHITDKFNPILEFIQFFHTMFDTLPEEIKSLVSSFGTAVENISKLPSTLVTEASKITLQIVDSVTGISQQILSMPVEIAKGLSDVISGITGLVGDLGKGVFNTVSDTVNGITDGIAKLFSFNDDDLKKITDAALQNVGQTLKPIDSINSVLSNMANDLATEGQENGNAKLKKFELKIDRIYTFLMLMSESMNGSFETISEKLDKQPAALPIPMPNNPNNLAAMENNL